MRAARRAAVCAALSTTVLTGAVVSAVVSAAPALAATARSPQLSAADQARVQRLAPQLRRLRQCESGGRYGIATGNGYYGAYQFAAATWHRLGYSGLPHQASPAVQDAAAARLWTQAGPAPWGGCGRYAAGAHR